MSFRQGVSLFYRLSRNFSEVLTTPRDMDATLSRALPYGIQMYQALAPELCDRLMEYFEVAPRNEDTLIVGRKELTFENIALDEDVACRNNPHLQAAMGAISRTVSSYLDEHVGTENYARQIKEGTYSLEPRMKMYAPGDEFPLHSDDASIAAMGRRFAYILYLNDDFKGGETIFRSGLKEIARVSPVRGGMLVFPVHPIFMHAGLPVLEGFKYILNGFVCYLPCASNAPAAAMAAHFGIDELADRLSAGAQKLFI